MPNLRRRRRFYAESLEQRLLLTANELVPYSYALVTEASSEPTELNDDFSYNGTGESVLVQKTETGKYRVDFQSLAGAGQDGGNVQVTAYGDEGHHCKAATWGSTSDSEDFSAGISCIDSSGEPVDSAFSVAVLHPSSVNPFLGPNINEGQTHFAWVFDFGATNFVADEFYASNRGNDVLVSRPSIGTYRVTFQDLGGEVGGTVQVSGYGSDDVRCISGGWLPSGDDFVATVRCADSDGVAANGAFSIAVIPAESDSSLAYAWAHQASSDGAYVPDSLYSHNPKDGDIVVQRRSTGRYRVTFSDAALSPRTGGNVQVTAYGDPDVHCNVTNFSSFAPELVADVGCFNSNGIETDSFFTVLALASPDGDHLEPNGRATFATKLTASGDQTLEDLSILSCGTEACSVPDYFLWTSSERGPVTISIESPNRTNDLDLEVFEYFADDSTYLEDFDDGFGDIYLWDSSLTPDDANESLTWNAHAGESFMIRVKGSDGSTNDKYRLKIDVAENYLTSIALDPRTGSGTLRPAIAHGDPVNVSFNYRTDEPDGVRVLVTPRNNGSDLSDYVTGPSVVYDAPSGAGTEFFTFNSGNIAVDEVRVTMMTADGSTVLFEEVRDFGADYQFGADLWTDITPQDRAITVAYDLGREPDRRMAGVPAWHSRSIWIRDSENDPGPNDNHLDHQNPEYGRTNEIYVNVRNRGAVASLEASVEFYVADASSGLSWSDDFEFVGTAALSSVAAGGAQTVSVPWDPDGRGHYCIVTRIVSDEDPITFPEDPDLDVTVFQNNNFAWRNVNTLDMTADGVLDSEFVFRNIVDTTLDLGLEFTDEENFIKAIGSDGGVAVDLGNLREGWLKTGANGENIELTNSGLVRLTGLPAKITGLSLDGNEEQVVRIRTEALQPIDLPGESTKFSFAVAQLVGDEPMGGVAYNIVARGRDADTDGDGVLDLQDKDDDDDGVLDSDDIDPVNRHKSVATPDVEVILGAVGGRVVGDEAQLGLESLDSDPANGLLRQTFSIRNNGTGELNIEDAIQISGSVTATNLERTVLPPGERTTFDIMGSKQDLIEATVGIKTNDPDTPSYEFKIQGDFVLLGDVNRDSRFTAEDIDLIRDPDSLLGVALRAADVDSNDTINESDVQAFVEDIVGTRMGDLDLVGGVQFNDFLTLSANFGLEGGWSQGDINGDGTIGFADFLVLSSNFGDDPTAASSGGQLPIAKGGVVAAAHGVPHDIVTPLKVMTYNVQMFPEALSGFTDLFSDPLNSRCCIDHRTEQIAREVLEKDIDIVGFQELFSRGSAGQVDEMIEPIMFGWFGPDWRDFAPQHIAYGPDSRALNASSGLLLLSKYPIIETSRFVYSQSSWPDTLARKGALHAEVRRTANRSLDVYVTQLDAGNDASVRTAQLRELSAFVDRTSDIETPAILLGDMNTNGRVEEDADRPAYDAMMAELRSELPFTDVWETFHESDGGGTTDQLSTTSGERLDYILYADAQSGASLFIGQPGDLVPAEITVDPLADARSEFLSAHSAVEATFDWHIATMNATDYDHFETGMQYEYFIPPSISRNGVVTTFDTIPDFPRLDPNHVDVITTGRFLDIDHRSNYYGVRYRGFINVPEPGEYAFHLSSDDGSKLYVNERLVVDNDGRHADREKIGYVTLDEGYHPVRLEYFQHRRGDELSLAWSGPTFNRNSLLPSDFSAPLKPSVPAAVAEPGLDYTYYHRSGDRIDLGFAPVVSSGRMTGNDYLANRERNENYGFRFQGHILAPADGLYTFETRSDDGSRLFIGNQYLVNNDGDHGPRTRQGRIYLRKGYHPIRIEYIQNGGGARLEVNWDGPGLGGLRGIDSSVFTLTPAEDVDHGDAPLEYYDSLDNIPTHGILQGFSLGVHVDADPRPLMSREANRDDLSFSPDDEDGVTNTGGGALTISGGLDRGVENTLQVRVNNSGEIPNPYLDAWIDFNQDGDWDDDGEHVSSQAVSAGLNSVAVAVPSDAAFGATFGRFRLHSSTLDGLSSFGPNSNASAGEMEDHRVIVRADFAQTLDMGTLRPTPDTGLDQFGTSVAIAGDTMVVGSPSHGEGGAAFVYVNDGGLWIRTSELTASDLAANDAFGSSVAISGNTIVIGAPHADDAGISSGSVYVFARSGTSWLEQDKLTASDASSQDTFGSSVDIDAGRIVTATKFSAYVFSQTGTDWSQTAQLTPPAPDRSLHSTGAVSIHGDTIAIGAPHYDGLTSNSGAVFVYAKFAGSAWSQQARIEIDGGSTNDRFGAAVSLHADTLAIGGNNIDGTGAAYAFVRDGTSWTQQAELQPSDLEEGDAFGRTVSVSGDGIVVGTPKHDVGSIGAAGSAYLFERDGTTWNLHEKLSLADPAFDDDFGTAVAIDGANVGIGSPFRASPTSGTTAGAAYVYGIDSTSVYDESRASTFIDPNLTIGGSTPRPFIPMLISPETVARTESEDIYFSFELTPRPGVRTIAPLVELDRADGGDAGDESRDEESEAVESAAEMPADESGKSSFLIAALKDGLYNAKSPGDKFDLAVNLVGDFNRDNSVDVEDGALLRAVLGTSLGDEDFDPDIDIDRNDRVDAEDYSLWRRNLGASILPIREENATVVVDPSIADFKEIEVDPIGNAQRPIAAITDGIGAPSYFVQNELVIETDDEAELKEFLERVNGIVIAEINPAQYQLEELRPTYLVQVDPGKIDASGLERDLFELNPEVRADYVVSSEDARGLLAAAAKEARNDFEVGINWIAGDSMFRDGRTVEGPSSPYGRDAFNWPYLSSGSTQDIGVAEAWRVMELAEVDSGPRFPIAIIDRGFKTTRDFGISYEVLPGSAPFGTPGWGWHGTRVAESVMGMADNGSAGAGPASEFGHALIAHYGGDFFSSSQAVMESYNAGARIINMSFGRDVFFPWSIRSLNRTTRAVSERGTLLFAAAGNEGENVDRTGRFGLVERRWHAPCENDGVICVGGLAEDSKDRHPGSNFGHEDVDIFAPYILALSETVDPASVTAGRIGGTSFASPFAAGVAAMIWKTNPDLSANEVSNILFSTAHSSPDRTVDSYVNALDAVMEALGGDAPPFVKIVSPIAIGSSIKPEDIVLEADVEDYEDGRDLPVVWSSDRQGRIGTDVALADLEPGEHVLTASVTDSAGQSTTDNVTVRIQGLNPIVNILKPDLPFNVIDFTGFHQNFNRWYADVSLAGEAKDADGNDLKGTQLLWTTNRTDLHGPQPLDSGGVVDVRLWGETQCSILTHVITLTATDSEGNSSSDSIEIELTNECQP